MPYKEVLITDSILVKRMGQCRNSIDRQRRIAQAALEANVLGLRSVIRTYGDTVTFIVPSDVPRHSIYAFEQLLRQNFAPQPPQPYPFTRPSHFRR